MKANFSTNDLTMWPRMAGRKLMQRANDVIAGIRAGWLKLNIGRVLPLLKPMSSWKLERQKGKLVLSVANSQPLS